MAIISQLNRHESLEITSMNGVVEATATYEFFENYIILRTEHDVIHIDREIGEQLSGLIHSRWP